MGGYKSIKGLIAKYCNDVVNSQNANGRAWVFRVLFSVRLIDNFLPMLDWLRMVVVQKNYESERDQG